MMKANSLFSLFLVLTTACVASSCSSDSQVEDNLATQVQALGEPATPYYANIVDPIQQIHPTHTERVIAHILNRIHISPQTWNIMDEGPNNTKVPRQPRSPLRTAWGATGPAEWFLYHQRTFKQPNGEPCACKSSQQDINAGIRSCCIPELQDGIFDCPSDAKVYACTNKDEETRKRQFEGREAASRGYFPFKEHTATLGFTEPTPLSYAFSPELLLTIGKLNPSSPDAGTLQDNTEKLYESFGNLAGPGIAPLVIATPVAETTNGCYEPKSLCHYSGGTCTRIDGDTCTEGCIGTCNGGILDGSTCDLAPEGKNVCERKVDPNQENAKMYKIAVSFVEADLPSSGFGVGLDHGVVTVNTKYTGSATSPSDGVVFSVNYFSPVAAPLAVYVVIDGQAEKLNEWASQKPQVDYANPDQNFGQVYELVKSGLSDGCHAYYFVAVDADGVATTYPEYGSLGVAIKSQTIDVTNIVDLADPAAVPDGQCNSFVYTRQAPATKITEITAEDCSDGQTRQCYTGDKGNLGRPHAKCAAGTETCQNGQWSGVCEGQVLPKFYEVCGDEFDNNCNGFVNEGCNPLSNPVKEKPAEDPNNNNPPADDDKGDKDDKDNANPDNGGGADSTTNKDDDGCSSTPATPSSMFAGMSALLGLALLRRRKQ